MKQSYPTLSDLKKFIEIFERLNRFEAEMRFSRKWGAFSESEIEETQPAIARVMRWLEHIMENQDNERIDTIEKND